MQTMGRQRLSGGATMLYRVAARSAALARSTGLHEEVPV